MTQRSLAFLKEQGYIPQVVEKWNAFARIRQDLYGIIDIVAIHPEKKGILGIQTTSSSNLSARRKKALGNTNLPIWLNAGNVFHLHGWRKAGKRGQRKIWQVTVEELAPGPLSTESPGVVPREDAKPEDV